MNVLKLSRVGQVPCSVLEQLQWKHGTEYHLLVLAVPVCDHFVPRSMHWDI